MASKAENTQAYSHELQQPTAHEWVHQVTAALGENGSLTRANSVILQISLAERLYTTFGYDRSKIIVAGTYRRHKTPDEAQIAKGQLDELQRELIEQQNQTAYRVIAERQVAGIIQDYFQVDRDFDQYLDALKWVDDVKKHNVIQRDVEGMQFTLVADTRHVLDNANKEMHLKDEELDRVLKDRLAVQFGPFSNDVYTVLYSPILDDSNRAQEIARLQDCLTESPWSGLLHTESISQFDTKGNIINTLTSRNLAAERLRFLLTTHTVGQPNTVGILFNFESRLAEQVR